MNEKNISIRLLIMITTPKLADKAKEILDNNKLPIQYNIHAKGTATSEIMDTLGLGSPEKSIVVSTIPHSIVNSVFNDLIRELKIGCTNSGIVFTIPLTGTNQIILKMLQKSFDEQIQDSGKGDTKMTGEKFSMIAAVVNRGYSADVMEAAKSAGASGGTVINSRKINNEEENSIWGLSIQEEKEIILIVSDTDSKINIMKKIGETCGMHSDAKGIVLSLPIDDAIGLKDNN